MAKHTPHEGLGHSHRQRRDHFVRAARWALSSRDSGSNDTQSSSDGAPSGRRHLGAARATQLTVKFFFEAS